MQPKQVGAAARIAVTEYQLAQSKNLQRDSMLRRWVSSASRRRRIVQQKQNKAKEKDFTTNPLGLCLCARAFPPCYSFFSLAFPLPSLRLVPPCFLPLGYPLSPGPLLEGEVTLPSFEVY